MSSIPAAVLVLFRRRLTLPLAVLALAGLAFSLGGCGANEGANVKLADSTAEAPKSAPNERSASEAAATPDYDFAADDFDGAGGEGEVEFSAAEPMADAGSRGPVAGIPGRGAVRPSPPAAPAKAPARPPRFREEVKSEDAAEAEEGPTAEAEPATDEGHRPDDSSREKTRQRQIRAGLLTAGSFDDHERLDDFKQFVSHALQHDPEERLPRFAVGERVIIHVTDGGDRPIGDAKVIVRAFDKNQQEAGDIVLSQVTASDGRTLLLSAHDRARAKAYEVTAVSPDGKQEVTQMFEKLGGEWRIHLPEAKPQLPNRLDLALVIDCTGSMGDELEYLKVELDGIVKAVKEMFPNVDQRYALVVYRDEGDEYVTRTFDFTGELADYRVNLASQAAGGGGDYPEAMHLAMQQAGKLDWRTKGTARVMFLIGDAPPHDGDCPAAIEAADQLREKCIRVYPVAASGAKMQAEFVLRSTAFLTLGQYLFLTDHSGVGNKHAAPHVPSYAVEHLNRLMIRMITSELAGKRLAPQEVIAIERGELDPAEGDQWVRPEPQESNEPPVEPKQPNAIENPQQPPEEAAKAGTAYAQPWSSFTIIALVIGGLGILLVTERSTRAVDE